MRINKDYWLLNTPIAHRGLWGGDLIENSLPAYQNAVNNGYAIEIDLYSTTDGEIVCFHDATLVRMTGADGFIYDKSLAELKALSLSNSNEKIPTLKELLALVDGKVPLLIEFKDQPDNSYIETAVNILKNYKGEFAVQGFNPLYLNKIKKLAPEFIRGILGTNVPPEERGAITKFVVKNLTLNFLIKPDFISYIHTGLPIKNKKKLPLLAWTVTSKEDAEKALKYANNIIFENFIPE
ncbi:MAG: glycerophosphodiester phosphodiesterase [Clostridia bacterium]|nr:glycerophosphodiester phosphodiesterase [Clostridia bacterium]